MRILLIDDDPNDRALVRREVVRDHAGAEIVEVESDIHLRHALSSGRIDLAVVDYSLGWTNGLTIVQRIRAVDPDCAAIMFTGTLGEENAVEAMKAGLDDYIVKDPARLPRLRASIHSLLQQRDQRAALRRAEGRYRALFEKVTVGLFACAHDGRFEHGNPALLTLLGVPNVAALRGLNLLDLIPSQDIRRCWQSLPKGAIASLETRLIRPDGTAMWVLLDAHPASEGAVGAIEGVVTDVTPLRTALEQKTILLKEVFHRVYNNLQIVESLLAFQERRFKDPEIRAGFREIGARIRSLSLIQQKLYRGDDFQTVDFAGYLTDLTTALVRAYRRSEVTAQLELDPLALVIDRAIPVGLMANELLTNALKHAFPHGRTGRVRVILRVEEEGEVALTIADDGVGVAGPVFAAQGGLGSQLVPRLAGQVQARLEEDRGHGFAVTVRFRP